MGNEIVYCTQCQTRLLAGDFDNAKAVWSSDKPYCVSCIMGLVASLGPEEEQRILEQLAQKRAVQSGASDTPRRGTSKKTSTSRIPVVKTERRMAADSGPNPVVLSLVGIAIVLVIVLALLLGGGGGKPAETPRNVERTVKIPRPETAAMPPPTEPPRDLSAARREEAARKALEKARQFGATHPTDLPGRITLLEEAAWECRETPLAAEARREHEQLQKQRGDWIAAEFAPIRDKAQAAASAFRYGEAIEILRKERARHPGTDWTSAVDQKVLQVRQTADQAYAPLREKTLTARRRGAEEEAQKIVKQVAGWGLDDLVEDLRASLAAIPLPEKPLSPEVRAWQAAWENGLALARARDFAAAIQGLEAAAPALTEPAMKSDAAADLELLRLCSAAVSDVIQALSKTAKGQKIALEFDAGASAPSRIDGIVTRASPTWIEVKTETDTVLVDFDDLTAAGLREILAKLPGRKAESDARAGAVLLLLEGQTSAASGVPPRWVAYGTRIAQERARPETASRDAEARARFDSAERTFQDPAARLDAFDKYRALLETHGETPFVRRKRAVISQRLDQEKDAGKEYFFFADQMRPAGSFRMGSYPKAAACLTSSADVSPDRENHVEFTFSARPSVEYRCWLYVGGCCAETFAFDAQGTEIERAPVKNNILFLKKTHAAHGGRKEPARFEWVAVPLPKYVSGGPKTVRVWSGQQGFSVAYALVSSTRTAAPGDTLVKEWEKSRPPVPTSPSRDVGLVGWWTFDEGSGTMAGDSSPLRVSGTLRNDPVWTSGKRRGALSFDGRDDYVEIGKDPRYYFQGPFTIAAWINIGSLPKSEFGMYVVSDYTPEGHRSTFAIRVLTSGAAQFFWQTEDKDVSHATSAARLTPGTWVHLAGVWDGTARTIYVNGTADGTNANPTSRPDNRGAVSIGRPGSFNGLYFNGRIDDVRIYNRALSSMEIQSLAKP
jgi:hypothetical protein